MALERHTEFRRRHPEAIIADGDQRGASVSDIDSQMRCAGVQGVLDQFLDHRGRALNNFPRGDLIDQRIGQRTDPALRIGSLRVKCVFACYLRIGRQWGILNSDGVGQSLFSGTGNAPLA